MGAGRGGVLLLLGGLLGMGGCTGKSSGDSATEEAGFGEGFLWGTAVAGFQVDPGCPTLPAEDCEDRGSDWYQWVTDPELIAEGGNHLSGDPLSLGPGHFELYAQDLDLAASLGTNAFRTSIEWSRVFPDGAAEAATDAAALDAYADPTAVAWYRAYFDAIRARGLTPLVTLTHYTLPLWVHDGKACHEDIEGCAARGWLDRDRVLPLAQRYAEWCGATFGDQVDLWATENEPLAIVLAGYLLPSADRTNPPGIADADKAIEVYFNLAEGHTAMYDGVKAGDGVDADGDGTPSRVGVVANLVATQPNDPTRAEDAVGVEHLDYVYNRMFLNAAIRGEFDRDVDGVAEEVHPELAGKMDYLGVNYYTRITVAKSPVPLFGGYAWMDFIPTVVWEEYPPGLADVAALGASYGVPVIITENGTTPDDTAGEDFLRPHLAALLEARQSGVDVQGYFYWSLLDNYEWNHGMEMDFGLYEVDLTTKARARRPIGDTYAEIISDGHP